MSTAMFPFFGWLLRASVQAAILTLLILFAQFFLRKHLDARWRYLLWLLVLARLAMPFSPPSPASLFNYLCLEPPAERAKVLEIEPPPTITATPSRSPIRGDSIALPPTVPVTRSIQPPPPVRSLRTMPKRPVVLAELWAVGVAALVIRVAAQNILFCRRLCWGRPVDELQKPQTLGIFAECKARMGVRGNVLLVETDAVKSPALYGLISPRLLLPPGLARDFNAAELRHVFLHELAHVRRRDMPAQWLVMCLQIAHWFNPVLWFGFQRMAADREMACDELALSVAGERDGRAYGQTIVKLLEACSQTSALPGLVGILEDKGQMLRRISMIARFKRYPRCSLLGAAAVAVLGLVTLTGAQTDKAPGRPDLTGTVQTTNGQPVMATVFISTAGPKVGPSPLCPSCYADCRKSAKTDKEGNFKIESLDPQLRFRILVVGEGCQPKFVGKVDPAKGPIKVSLEPRDLSVPLEKIVLGRVIDPHGAPIEGAAVEVSGMHYKNGGGIWGEPEDTDPLAVSGTHGEFILTSRKDFTSLDLKVEARGFANRTFTDVAAGGEIARSADD